MAKKKKTAKKAARAVSAVSSYKPLEHHFHSLKPAKSRYIVVGMWALILAILGSVMLALVETPYLALILVAVGFIVGFMNFEHEETVKFLVSAAVILIVATAILMTGFSRLEIVAPVVALYLKRAAFNVISVAAPVAFIISLKALKELAE